MDWRDIACIVFFCTAVNHLGLIGTIEGIIKHSLPIINCPKCFTFWSVLLYGLASCNYSLPFREGLGVGISLLATALLSSYIAIWLNLLFYAIDTLNNRIYGKIKDYNQEDEGGTD